MRPGFEIFEMIRRLMLTLFLILFMAGSLTLFLVLFMAGSAGLIAMAMLIAPVSLIVAHESFVLAHTMSSSGLECDLGSVMMPLRRSISLVQAGLAEINMFQTEQASDAVDSR